jgi:AAA15 family ATPase/GTPase
MTAPTTAHFLTDIEIKEFKCFKDFKASGFKRVNLIGGKNNVGKTAFMEACFINIYSISINTMILAISNVKFRREKINLIEKKYEMQKSLDTIKKYSTKSNLSYKEFFILEEDGFKNYEFNINGDVKYIDIQNTNINNIMDNICFIDNLGYGNEQLSLVYQDIQKKDQENNLNFLIKDFDEKIDSFKIIGDKPQCKTNGEYRDITEFGDGLKHYISIICALYACENGYLFIDEIDNGIYYDHLDRLWEIIFTLSKKTNCQIFATTHSKEMLESFARVAKKLDEQDVSYTRLIRNKKQELKSITFDYEVLEYSLENEHEVR